VINGELALYSAELRARPQIIAVNKMDLPVAQAQWPALQAALEARGSEVVAISAVTGQGIDTLGLRVMQLLKAERARIADLIPQAEQVIIPPQVDDLRIEHLDAGVFRVHGRRAERALVMTDLTSEESLNRLQALLKRFGVTAALEKAGVADGDTVFIGDAELLWGNVMEEPHARRPTRRERIARRREE
jgi:GTP-binding protein